MEAQKGKILVADDEKEIREVLKLLLSGEGYEVAEASDGREALELADASIDLYVLDVNMPSLSGYAVGAELRKRWDAPIMFLTAYSGESDKVMGFSAGADDYMVKPFSNMEFLLRVRALLRRARRYGAASQAGGRGGEEGIRYKDLLLDRDSQSVRRGEEQISLTWTEYQILELLFGHPKKIFSLENIYQSVWQEEAVGDSTIMVHIKNLRKKLGDSSRNPKYIKTAWGKGYYAE